MHEVLGELCKMLDKYNVKHENVDPITAPALCRKLKVVAKHDSEAMLVVASIQAHLANTVVSTTGVVNGIETITVKHIRPAAAGDVSGTEKEKEKEKGKETMDQFKLELSAEQRTAVRRIVDEVFIFGKLSKLAITSSVKEAIVAEFAKVIERFEVKIGEGDIVDIGPDITERDSLIAGVTGLAVRLMLNPVESDLKIAKYIKDPTAVVVATVREPLRDVLDEVSEKKGGQDIDIDEHDPANSPCKRRLCQTAHEEVPFVEVAEEPQQ